jgi:hypothetical protein
MLQLYDLSILQCQKVQNNRHTLMKKAETNDILNIFYCVLYHVRDYTDAVSYHSLYMNQGHGKNREHKVNIYKHVLKI